jgi:hypothetical protein
MAKLTAATRKKLPTKVFGLPEKAPGPGSYPMPDKKHAAVAEAYAKHDATPAQQARIRAKAHRLFPGMQMHSLKSMAS